MPYSNNHNLHVIVRDIDWETDGQTNVAALPKTVVIPLTYEELEDEDLMHDMISDHLSDTYGWLVKDYKLGWKKKDEV
jgi:hypothetical protein